MSYATRFNLNALTPIELDSEYQKPASRVSSGAVEAIFDDLKPRLIQEIERWPAVVACVAWLTDLEILAALASREAVQIVVSKEDFLRPDVGRFDKEALRKAYRALRFQYSRYDELPQVSHLSYCSDPAIDAVRCCGVYDANRSRPRQHNKFAVFCDPAERGLTPRAVWTGSYNWTISASLSFENAVLIEDDEIARGYFDQWGHILAVSEPLNWSHQYADPEWRVGT